MEEGRNTRKSLNVKLEAELHNPQIKSEGTQLDENEPTPERINQDYCLTPLRENTDSADWDSETEYNAVHTLVKTPSAALGGTMSIKQNQENEPKTSAGASVHGKLFPAAEPENSYLNDRMDIENKFNPPLKTETEPEQVVLDEMLRNGLTLNPRIFFKQEDWDKMNLCSYEEVSKEIEQKPSGSENKDNDCVELKARVVDILNELDDLDEEITTKKRNKHKKGKSYRSRSDLVESPRARKKRHRSRSRSYENTERKRCRERSPRNKSSSKRRNYGSQTSSGLPRAVVVKDEADCLELGYLRVRRDEKTIKPVKLTQLMDEPQQQQNTKPPALLTLKEKRKLAVERVTALLRLFKLQSSKSSEDFLFVETIHKQPNSTSFMNQGIFENPSPICNNYNVKYKFNSMAGTRFSLAKWGLEALPATTTNLLHITGVDVNRLKQLQTTTKMSQRMLKLRQEAAAKAKEIKVEDFGTSLYSSSSTQTDGTGVRVHNVGVQATLGTPRPNGAFWQDPNFNEMDLTQQQANVMYSLQELYSTLPSQELAVKLCAVLRPALLLKRTVERRY